MSMQSLWIQILIGPLMLCLVELNSIEKENLGIQLSASKDNSRRAFVMQVSDDDVEDMDRDTRNEVEALDDHLTTIQRDHKHRSQIEERRIRDDAAREEAKRKEQAIQEEKARQGSEQKPSILLKAAKEATAAAAAEKSPESLTTVPSEASKVSRDVTSKPARSISDWQKHSAGISLRVILVMEWR
ncbi:putative spermidine synthase 1-like [Capsicum annuum]|nr:putative spermidine synthase 1-like [Capsicum annuum]KAF3622054.1 putative spermidine synthase 1-like [Capsicum annuum]